MIFAATHSRILWYAIVLYFFLSCDPGSELPPLPSYSTHVSTICHGWVQRGHQESHSNPRPCSIQPSILVLPSTNIPTPVSPLTSQPPQSQTPPAHRTLWTPLHFSTTIKEYLLISCYDETKELPIRLFVLQCRLRYLTSVTEYIGNDTSETDDEILRRMSQEEIPRMTYHWEERTPPICAKIQRLAREWFRRGMRLANRIVSFNKINPDSS